MRSAAFALALLVAVAVSAQIMISDEVVSDPLQPRRAPVILAVPSVALAQDRIGVAIAWTAANDAGADRLYAARLDDAGNVTGPIRQMPPADEREPAILYTGGGEFLVAYETINNGERASDAPTPFDRTHPYHA